MAVSLFNGSASLVLPSWTPPSCVAAFETGINCDPVNIQLLTSADDNVGWTTAMLQTLCTQDCRSSIANLRNQVSTACAGLSFYYGTSGNLSYTEIIDTRQYKFDIACLRDDTAQQYCLDVEQSWNISALDAAGAAQWPQYTTKSFPDYSTSDLTPYRWDNGSLMSFSDLQSQNGLPDDGPLAQNDAVRQGNWGPQDWYTNTTNATYSNHGWNYALAFDEYPLQIQCSSCFQQKLQYGLQSPYGLIYDEILAQTWTNVQSNCNINITLTPANNIAAIQPNLTNADYQPQSLNGTDACAQYLTASDLSQRVSALAVQSNVPLASLLGMNDIRNDAAGALPLCAPQACQIAINTIVQPARNFVGSQNVSMLLFLQWNPYIDLDHLAVGEAVCVGPPGGAYTPTMAAASATSFSTKATPAAPTVTGTLDNCGLYYNVSAGDYCNLISQRFGISLAQLLGMNQAIYSDCSNLFLGYDYCVAPCCGATAPVLTTTRAPPATSTVSSTTIVASATSGGFAAPPGPTQAGASPNCYQWYVTQSGDYCYLIEQKYSISADQFLRWNPELDSSCNVYLGYAYCVSGP